MIRMRSVTVFANPRVRTESGSDTVQLGEEFRTDMDHARELRRGGLAYPLNPEELDGPPVAVVAAIPTAPALVVEGKVSRRRAEGVAE